MLQHDQNKQTIFLQEASQHPTTKSQMLNFQYITTNTRQRYVYWKSNTRQATSTNTEGNDFVSLVDPALVPSETWATPVATQLQHTAGKGHRLATLQNQLHSSTYTILFHKALCLTTQRFSYACIPSASQGNACWLENSSIERSFSYSPQQTTLRLSMLGGSSTCPERKQLTPLSSQFRLKICPGTADTGSGFIFFFPTEHHVHEHLKLPTAHHEGVMIWSAQRCLGKHLLGDLACKDQLLLRFLPLMILQH